jgi:hypothetical protein
MPLTPRSQAEGGITMHDVRFDRPRMRISAGWLGKAACGAALTLALFGFGGVQPVAAQDDDTIVLSAGGAELSVTPGGEAAAIGAAASAIAEPGHAETTGAAARAVADCEDGALAEGAAALAVAHPDEGALTQSSAREMVASIQEEVRASIRDGDDDDSPVRKIVENRCGEDEKDEKKEPPKKEEKAPEPAPAPEPEVVQVPDTGVGMAGAAGLSSLFAAASAAAAFGAMGLRTRREFDVTENDR